jgi:hypothetical protein
LPGTYEYNGSVWVSTIPTGAPGGRTQAVMVSDSQRDRVVLFGGGSNQYHNDIWEYLPQSAWPEEICGNALDDDSDGVTDCVDPDCQWSSACEFPEATCGDGIDNDGDGVHDCQDGDCLGDAACTGGSCDPATAITCNDVVMGDNTGGPSAILNYGCGGVSASGPESYYGLTTAIDREVTLTLTGLSADLNVYVVAALSGGGCEFSSGCIELSTAGGTANEQLTFNTTAGVLYYVIVDGFSGATSSFDLDIACL